MNHPHEQQAAAMARAGEMTDGELSMSMFASREDYDKAVLRASADQLAIAGHDFWSACKKDAGGRLTSSSDSATHKQPLQQGGRHHEALDVQLDDFADWMAVHDCGLSLGRN